MKHLLTSALLVLALGLLAGCNDDKSYQEPELEVTPHNMAGTWQLMTWHQGESLPEGCFVYLQIIRKDSSFILYENTGSFQARKLTGNFTIETDPYLGSVIRGMYDHQTGDWQHRYIVTGLYADRMTWTATDAAEDISLYQRCAEIPAEILALFPEEE